MQFTLTSLRFIIKKWCSWARKKIRERKTNHVILFSRVIALHIIQTVRVRITTVFTRVCAHALIHDAMHVAHREPWVMRVHWRSRLPDNSKTATLHFIRPRFYNCTYSGSRKYSNTFRNLLCIYYTKYFKILLVL